MISVPQADTIIREHALPFPNTLLPLDEAIGRVLREDIHADRDMPPYDRVAMDGIALRHQAYASGRRTFHITGVAAAGAPQLHLSKDEHCIEVMTGAMLPTGADTVIRYEDLQIENGKASLQVERVEARQNIHTQGLDRSLGDRVIEAGKVISAAEVGVAATVGKSLLRVAEVPKTIVVSSGDELVDVSQTPLPYQIRKSNVHRLLATLRGWGIQADSAHLADDKEHMREALEKMLEHYKILLLSGGVSKGKFDYLPEVLKDLGLEKLFHKVSQRPGKPFWFGRSAEGAMVFALPGNPVSSFLCTLRYFRPWLDECLGLGEKEPPRAILTRALTFRPELTYFPQVKISITSQGVIEAEPVVGHGSGDLANLVDADAFLELPPDREVFPAGEAFPFWPYRNLPH